VVEWRVREGRVRTYKDKAFDGTSAGMKHVVPPAVAGMFFFSVATYVCG
jgi:hypothetical protein